MARVEFNHVYKRFNKVEIVHDINLDIKDKEFLVLVGPSGCGKSTCLRMVAGLEEVSEGEVLIGDRVVNGVPPKDRDIAMVFQNYALYPHMTVYDNIAFGLKLRHFPRTRSRSAWKRRARSWACNNC
jgi:multiple sugar transport system ATP-binding protein